MTQTQRDLALECDRLKALLLRKNRSYGNSALEPIRVFSRADAESALLVRLDDKLARIARSGDWSNEDTLLDLLGYLVLLRVHRKQQRRKRRRPSRSALRLPSGERR